MDDAYHAIHQAVPRPRRLEARLLAGIGVLAGLKILEQLQKSLYCSTEGPLLRARRTYS